MEWRERGRTKEKQKGAVLYENCSCNRQQQRNHPGSGKEMGVAVLPMPFMIDGETYYEDITLTREQFYQRLKDNADIATSQPTPDSILKMWDKLLKEYDQIIHIPMSSGLSGSCSTAMMLAGEDEYEEKCSSLTIDGSP